MNDKETTMLMTESQLAWAQTRDGNREQLGNQFERTTWLGHVGYQASNDRHDLLGHVKELEAQLQIARAAQIGTVQKMDLIGYALEHEALTNYLKAKTASGDWHAVSDAANDLRVLEAAWQAQSKEGSPTPT